ncbi:hypothetical protein ES332_D05G160800v1 [Gossypium tomentosum]|uniref:Uncharacterized protein n=1 Tax=Gossypium tomentosum TaxID=34277 RepID=A0A5D2KWK7_GOSTO|nr:hypothetical protein ES332_D05G160800v1 [Gossypium tomentosum]
MTCLILYIHSSILYEKSYSRCFIKNSKAVSLSCVGSPHHGFHLAVVPVDRQ